jgi:two-component system LytT family sensor kinase
MTVKTKILRHSMIWLIFISYEVAYINFTVGIQASIFHFAVYYALNIGLFYANAHLILDFAFFKTSRPYLIATGLIVLELTLYFFVKFGLDFILSGPHQSLLEIFNYNSKFLLAKIWRGIYFIGFSIAYWATRYMIRFRNRNHQMETEQLKSIAATLELENKFISVENAFLQNQISPHLLFNSLSFIHGKVYKESAEAGNGVSRLAELMRYSLIGPHDSRTVLLSREVAQLENLVELCRMRFQDQFYLRFKKKGKLSTVQIIPLVLVTLVENMMKHGDIGNKKYPAQIILELDGNHLSFIASNLKRNTNLYPKNGLGLENMEKRLINYYNDRYKLLICDEKELFTVNLSIYL